MSGMPLHNPSHNISHTPSHNHHGGSPAGLETFPPIPLQLRVAGEALQVSPLTLGELPRFILAVRPLAGLLDLSDLSAAGLEGSFNWIWLLGQHGEAMLELLALASRRERRWVNALSLDDAVALASAVWEVNADFFVEHVVPAIQRAALRLQPRPLPVPAATSDGTTPLPGSSAPGTGTAS